MLCLRDCSWFLTKGMYHWNFTLFHQTPLHLAVMQNQPETVKTLLSIGANPNIITKQGDLPLHLAVSASHNECISELLHYNNSRDCNLTNYNGES